MCLVRCFACQSPVVFVGRARLTSWLVCDKSRLALVELFAFRIQEVDPQLVVPLDQRYGKVVAEQGLVALFEMSAGERTVLPRCEKYDELFVPTILGCHHLRNSA